MVNFSYITFVLIIPLMVFLVTGLFGKKMPALSGILGTVGMFAAAGLSYFAEWPVWLFCFT